MSAPSAHVVSTRAHFTLRRVLLAALPLLVLLLWIVALTGLASAGSTATPDAPARLPVQIPAAAQGARIVMLEMSIAVTRKPSAGQLGALVRLVPPGGGAVEIGRVTIPHGEQSFQFNVSQAIGRASAGSAEIEVSVIDRGGGAPPAGAALSIGHAQIITR